VTKKRKRNHPDGLKDEEQFGRDHDVRDEDAVRYARKHLRTRQRHEARIPLKTHAH